MSAASPAGLDLLLRRTSAVQFAEPGPTEAQLEKSSPPRLRRPITGGCGRGGSSCSKAAAAKDWVI